MNGTYQKTKFMPEVGAAMGFYRFVKDVDPTAEQIQALLTVVGIQADLENIARDKAILLELLAQAEENEQPQTRPSYLRLVD